jgi:superfamily I DNA and/or RNA helicase
MEKILQSYLKRLTNLSSNNRSLLFLRLISDQSVDLHDFNHSLDNPSFDIIKQLIAKKSSIALTNEIDTHDSEANKASQKLKKIDRIEKFIFQERGAKDLYVGWPFVRGKFMDDTLVRAPLIFFPVSLELIQNKWYLKQREDVNITFNKSLLLAYYFYNKITPDEELIEKTLTDLDPDAIAFRTKLYDILKQSNLEINFNQDNFTDKLTSFVNFSKSELTQNEKTGKLKLYPEAVLGIFPQAGSYLVPDYIKMIEAGGEGDLSSLFVEKNKVLLDEEDKTKYSDKVKEETTFLPFTYDASQEASIRLIKRGQSMVVQGPPGSGKSQLISNLICDYITRGKTVLLVCQKKAALDVVYDRLQSKELSDFAARVHDFKNDRKVIFDQIAHLIDHIDLYRQKNNGLDAIHLERSFLQASRKIDQATEELDEFKKALFDDTECGKSVKELYLSSDPDKRHITLNQEYRQFHYSKLPEFIHTLKQYLDYFQRFANISNFWRDRPSYASFTSSDLSKLKEIIDDALAFHESIKLQSAKFLSRAMDYETCLHFLTHKENIQLLITNLDNELVFGYYKLMQSHKTERQPWLSDLERATLQCFKGAGIEKSLQSTELGRFQEALEHAINARRGFFSWLKWRIFSKDKIFITRVLIANQLKSDKEGFNILLERIDNRLNFEHVLSKIQGTPWLSDFPKTYRTIEIQNWFFYQKLAYNSNDLANEAVTLSDFAPHKDHTRISYVSLLKQLDSFLDEIPVQTQLWSRYLSEKQIRALLLGKEEPEIIKKHLNRDFDSFVEYDKINEKLNNGQRKIIGDLIDEDSQSKEEILETFANSLALVWIDHIESKYPILRAVSSMKLDHLTQELREAVEEKSSLSKEIVLLKAREKTYHNLEYNRLNNLVTYRDLYHQVTKKRKVWPIRKVISQYKEELFSILPCWMTSPESASAIFPMEQIFDLVIFDEASQCFAERGLPAMFRGAQVVVTGDDQQLQPNDLYRVRWEDDETEDTPELEIDSLLGLAKHYLPEAKLQGHYRSKSLELIEFSNQHFYGGNLQLLPDFNYMKSAKPSINYVKVNGEWEDNTNLVEAKYIVALLASLTRENNKKSIGVVTFNVRQQGLILDLIDEEKEKNSINLPEAFFVKNIENVQGDEKDIIIFSTAYANDSKGKLNLKFGSLNMAGGENRLNVAITRAREQIYMITSLVPSDLHTENLKNDGPKLFKKYLEYAYEVSIGKWKPQSPNKHAHGEEWYLKNLLKTEKFENGSLISELPFADISVKSQGSYRGLIMTDDEIYFDSLSAKEAHAHRLDHFTEKHWPFVQFYSREYWIDREHTFEKLRKFVHRAID